MSGIHTFHSYSPAELALDDEDMTAVADTEYLSGILDWRNVEEVRVVAQITETGAPTTGTASISWRPTNAGGTALHEDIALVTAIDTKVDGNAVVFFASRNLAPDQEGATIGATAVAMFPLGWGKLVLTVTEQNNGTTSTADVYADVR